MLTLREYFLPLLHSLAQLLLDVCDLARNEGFHDGFLLEVLFQLSDFLLLFPKPQTTTTPQA